MLDEPSEYILHTPFGGLWRGTKALPALEEVTFTLRSDQRIHLNLLLPSLLLSR